MSRRTNLGYALSLASACLLLAGCGASATATSATTNVPGIPTSFLVPVRVCPTWYGLKEAGTSTLLRPRAATLPQNLGGDFLFDTDVLHLTGPPILAPANWSCSYGFGADGTWGVTSTSPVDVNSNVAAAAASSTLSAIWFDLCGFYAYRAAGFGTCPNGPAHGERVVRRAGSAVYFVDPAGVKGTAPGSGGHLATHGVVVEIGLPGERPTAVVEGCTLPPAQLSWCQPMLQDFVSRH
jgi:hypothetical protein